MEVIVLILSCNGVITEANRICYNVPENLGFNERMELFNLLILVRAKKPCYTAAGFFTLNKSTLFALLSTTTTYFIILVQFHQSIYIDEGVNVIGMIDDMNISNNCNENR